MNERTLKYAFKNKLQKIYLKDPFTYIIDAIIPTGNPTAAIKTFHFYVIETEDRVVKRYCNVDSSH